MNNPFLSSPYCRVQLMGRLHVTQGERSITRFRDAKTASLFAYLVYFRRRSHPREELAYLFWPDSDANAGRVSLSTALSSLHKLLEPPGVLRGTVLIADRNTIQCNPESIATDVNDFETDLHRASRAEVGAERLRLFLAAVEHVKGELLPGFTGDWVLTERLRLQTAYLDALAKSVEMLEEAQEWDRAIETAQKIVASDPLHEEAHETLIRLYAASGDTNAARRQYRTLTQILQKENGKAPDPTLSRYWKEKQTQKGELKAGKDDSVTEAPSVAPPPLHPTPYTLHPVPVSRLPLRLTRFFGREAEISALRDLLCAEDIRLVTLTGSGGNGKTRLALEAAEKLLPDWNGNVWFVPLADIAEPRQIPAAIRDTLGLPRSGEDPLDQIVAALHDRPVLLLLDTFEHLLPHDAAKNVGAEIVGSLLRRLPHLTCFITSREILGLAGEREFVLYPLPTPQHSRLAAPEGSEGTEQQKTGNGAENEPYTLHPTPHTLLTYPGVQMFVDRAQTARPEFQMTENNAAAVATLCEKLEGIPLALELAAARAQIMTPVQMLRQLDAPFDFLASRRKDLAPRHQTLFKAMDWSFRHLTLEERDFFARLSVFRGGWTAEAAAAVACPECRDEADTLEHLAQLRRLSLTLTEGRDGATRFRMLEMLRTFGRAQLTAQERTDLQRQHALYFLQFAETARDGQRGEQQSLWLDRAEAERENFYVALQWAQENDEGAIAMRLCCALGRFFWMRGHGPEACIWFERSLALPGAEDETAARASVLYWCGLMKGAHEGNQTEFPYLLACLKIYREQDDKVSLMDLLFTLVFHYEKYGKEGAEEFCTEALTLAEEFKATRHHADALLYRCLLAYREEDAGASIALTEEMIALHREGKNSRYLAIGLLILACLLPDEAKRQALHEEALGLFYEVGDAWGIAGTRSARACDLAFRGDYAAALPALQDVLPRFREIGAVRNYLGTLGALAMAHFRLGDPETALTLADTGIEKARAIGYVYLYTLLPVRARLLLHDGDVAGAAACLREGLPQAGKLRNILESEAGYAKFTITGYFTTAAGVLLEARRPDSAATVLGAIHACGERAPSTFGDTHRLDYDLFLPPCRAALPAAEFEAHWNVGLAMTSEDCRLYLEKTLETLRG